MVEKVKKVIITVKVKQNDLRVSMFHEVRGERRQEPWTTQEGSFDRITHKSYQSLMYLHYYVGTQFLRVSRTN